MINKLRLTNFQSHKDSLLKFDKGVNVIVGQTDSGKSAILRGLKLVIYNEPNGDEYRSNWGGDTQVSIEVDNKQVTRIKTNSKNLYELSDFDEPFAAFGQSVPDEIKKLLNMEAVNLQQQMDAPFLISETSGKIALHFNKIANLDKIDRAQSKVQKEINAINSELKHRQKELEIKEDSLKDFPDLKALEKELVKLERLEKDKEEIETSIKELTKLGNQLNGIQIEIHNCEQEVKAEKEINEILSLYKKQKTLTDELEDLNLLLTNLEWVTNKIKEHESKIKAEESINELLKLYENRQKAAISANNLEKLYNNSTRLKKWYTGLKIELNKLEVSYKNDFPDTCPLCNSKIKKL